MSGNNTQNILNYLKNKNIKIFFSGIGGISMSAIAAALKQKGHTVGGSDIKEKSETVQLRDMGIEIFISHKSENVNGYDLLVYNARIKDDNPEIIRAKELNIPIIRRTEMLGALMQSCKASIGIAGTHGKSTVTSMMIEIFMQAETDPTFFIGAVYPPVNSAYKLGKDDYFIAEADEYSGFFADSPLNIAVILNIEMDHPDHFKDLQDVISCFEEYLSHASDTAIINADDENTLKASKNFKSRIITFGLQSDKANIFIKNIDYSNLFPEFDIVADGKLYAHIKLSVPGEFNIYNAAAAASSAYACGIGGSAVEAGLNIFKGASRRFEYKGELNGAKIYDDYAHHPTAIKKNLMEIKRFTQRNNKNLWCVFQPHTYSRTYELFGDLCEALSHADKLILTEIYSATEKNIYNIHSKDIAEKLNNCILIEDFGEIAEHLKKNASGGDIILIMGAGDINNLTQLLI
ncbi:MAG: UDP-N-acetylmuramate--L-alanine ligase [Oscillospiraceae bacterium]|nr:UDP-N-acetylmuramate--L-alanine ligase [Oscillospiraceae bacterium]